MTVGRFVQMDEVAIARLCYEVNRGYRKGIGEKDDGPWESVHDDIRTSTIRGVIHALKNPDATPESMHEAWLKDKATDGWVYGEEKDFEKKTHPCFRPYGELPEAQRVKDHLFLAVVRANS